MMYTFINTIIITSLGAFSVKKFPPYALQILILSVMVYLIIGIVIGKWITKKNRESMGH